MSSVYIDAVGLAAPGLPNWKSSLPILRGNQTYTATAMAPFTPTMLPANEQRRATATVRLAFRVAEEAVANSEYSADTLATVFASSDADMAVSHRLCTALMQPQRLVSPTDFHNSVHNAPSGYWHIGARSRLASSAVAGHDYSFAVGLLEAITQVSIEKSATLLVCYDVLAPEPLFERRPLGSSFAMAIVLSPTRSVNTIATITVDNLNATNPETSIDNILLEQLRLSNPAAKSLPLLTLLATRTTGRIYILRSSDRLLALDVSFL